MSTIHRHTEPGQMTSESFRLGYERACRTKLPVDDLIRSRIPVPHDKLDELCERWNLTQIWLFGSILRDDFRPDSDVDVLVSYNERARPSLFTLAKMERDFEEIFGRKVDLGERRGVEQSRNEIRKTRILASARLIHEA